MARETEVKGMIKKKHTDSNQRVMDLENRLVVAERRGGTRRDWEFGVVDETIVFEVDK